MERLRDEGGGWFGRSDDMVRAWKTGEMDGMEVASEGGWLAGWLDESG